MVSYWTSSWSHTPTEHHHGLTHIIVKWYKRKKQKPDKLQMLYLINPLKGYCTPNQKLACFVCYLKIINTFLKNNICIWKQIAQGTQNRIEILIGEVMDQNSQNIVLIKNSRTAWPTYYFWVPWIIYYKCHILFFNKMLIILRSQNTLILITDVVPP